MKASAIALELVKIASGIPAATNDFYSLPPQQIDTGKLREAALGLPFFGGAGHAKDVTGSNMDYLRVLGGGMKGGLFGGAMGGASGAGIGAVLSALLNKKLKLGLKGGRAAGLGALGGGLPGLGLGTWQGQASGAVNSANKINQEHKGEALTILKKYLGDSAHTQGVDQALASGDPNTIVQLLQTHRVMDKQPMIVREALNRMTKQAAARLATGRSALDFLRQTADLSSIAQRGEGMAGFRTIKQMLSSGGGRKHLAQTTALGATPGAIGGGILGASTSGDNSRTSGALKGALGGALAGGGAMLGSLAGGPALARALRAITGAKAPSQANMIQRLLGGGTMRDGVGTGATAISALLGASPGLGALGADMHKSASSLEDLFFRSTGSRFDRNSALDRANLERIQNGMSTLSSREFRTSPQPAPARQPADFLAHEQLSQMANGMPQMPEGTAPTAPPDFLEHEQLAQMSQRPQPAVMSALGTSPAQSPQRSLSNPSRSSLMARPATPPQPSLGGKKPGLFERMLPVAQGLGLVGQRPFIKSQSARMPWNAGFEYLADAVRGIEGAGKNPLARDAVLENLKPFAGIGGLGGSAAGAYNAGDGHRMGGALKGLGYGAVAGAGGLLGAIAGGPAINTLLRKLVARSPQLVRRLSGSMHVPSTIENASVGFGTTAGALPGLLGLNSMRTKQASFEKDAFMNWAAKAAPYAGKVMKQALPRLWNGTKAMFGNNAAKTALRGMAMERRALQRPAQAAFSALPGWQRGTLKTLGYAGQTAMGGNMPGILMHTGLAMGAVPYAMRQGAGMAANQAADTLDGISNSSFMDRGRLALALAFKPEMLSQLSQQLRAYAQ